MHKRSHGDVDEVVIGRGEGVEHVTTAADPQPRCGVENSHTTGAAGRQPWPQAAAVLSHSAVGHAGTHPAMNAAITSATNS